MIIITPRYGFTDPKKTNSIICEESKYLFPTVTHPIIIYF